MLLLPASGPRLHGRLSSNVRPQIHKRGGGMLASARLPKFARPGRHAQAAALSRNSMARPSRRPSVSDVRGANAEDSASCASREERPRREERLDSQSVEPPPMEAAALLYVVAGGGTVTGWGLLVTSVRLRRAVGCLGLTPQAHHRRGSPLRPNPSLEPTRSGKAHWPPRAPYYDALVGQWALPPWSAQLKR